MTLAPESQRPCPHCGAENPAEAAFCEACGKALPRATGGPRIASGDTLPTSAAGTRLVSDELAKQTKTAATALLVVAIIQLVVGGILLAFLVGARAKSANVPAIVQTLAVAQVVIGAIFLALYFWARRSPLPASITGVVVYGTLIVVNVVVNANGMTSANGQSHGVGVGCLDILIIVLLVRGIKAALKQRQLLTQ